MKCHNEPNKHSALTVMRCMQQMVAPELAANNKGVSPWSEGSSTRSSLMKLVSRLQSSIGSTLHREGRFVIQVLKIYKHLNTIFYFFLIGKCPFSKCTMVKAGPQLCIISQLVILTCKHIYIPFFFFF